ncbi:LOW QUALITY PROTEIN: hypothetical protein QC763_105480 [Podospora pseudopauciseta]|uniref:Uncharacterized protein n=1 Tax=Podospora pseudopauciseta TaxID=2093780 RepID=A0ABR0HYB2_9PEZI|nr:LOW QUALITY PROTEIN: hypothetical protein QC763_105480 [Podospora pseudopauciseta]
MCICRAFSLAGVANANGYCSLALAEAVLGCGTLDIDLGGSSFRADILPDRIIISATEPLEEDAFRAEGSSTTETTETTSSATGVSSLVYRFARPAGPGGLLWALDLQQASMSTIRSTVTSTRTSTRTSKSTSTSTSTRTSTRPTTSTLTVRATSTSTARSTSTPTRTSTRTSTSTSTSTLTRRFPFLTIGRSAASSTVAPTAITGPNFPGAPRFPPGRTLHTSSSSSSPATVPVTPPVSPTRLPAQDLLSLHGVLNTILGRRSYRAKGQDKDEPELYTPKGSSNLPGPISPATQAEGDQPDLANNATELISSSLPPAWRLLDINIDLSRINIDLDVYLGILGGSASSSGGGGGLVSGLLDGILGRRELKAKAEEKAGEARERAEELRDRLRADAREKKRSGCWRRRMRLGVVLFLLFPLLSRQLPPSATSTGAAPPPRPAKGNNRLSRPEVPAGEVTETAVTVEEVSEEVVAEECILTCERASVKASVEAGEVRGCLGVTVTRRARVDNCVYFVGGVEVVDLEVVLLIEEEVQGGKLGEEVDEDEDEDEDLRSDSFVPVGRVRRE